VAVNRSTATRLTTSPPLRGNDAARRAWATEKQSRRQSPRPDSA
jgi:hypothetical protein